MSDSTTIGRYEVRSCIGEGGMGKLFLAWDPQLERHIAIKTLTQDDREFRERFAREARAAARLRHPRIVTIHDVGEYEGRPYIAMEFCQGDTLETLLRRPAGLDIERKIALLEQLCDGLAFAHRAGIVHRDIKPANLMVNTEGQVKILDFGVARFTHSEGLTQAGSVIGTLNYMSPEQIQGRSVDHRSDIFSVGLVAYELLSGRQAFPGQLSSGLLQRLLHEEPPPLAPSLPGSLAELAQIVSRAMAKNPQDRFQDLDDMRLELSRLQSRQVALAWEPTERMAAPEATLLDQMGSLPSRGTSLGNHANRSKPIAWLVRAALLVALAGLVLILLWRAEGAEDAPLPLGSTPSETRTLPIEPHHVDSPPPPESNREVVHSSPRVDALGRSAEGDPPIPGPSAAQSLPSAASSAQEVPPECTRLLERQSLGETLSEAERQTLASKCRS